MELCTRLCVLIVAGHQDPKPIVNRLQFSIDQVCTLPRAGGNILSSSWRFKEHRIVLARIAVCYWQSSLPLVARNASSAIIIHAIAKEVFFQSPSRTCRAAAIYVCLWG